MLFILHIIWNKMLFSVTNYSDLKNAKMAEKYPFCHLCVKYVVVQFYPWFKICFPFFLGMVSFKPRIKLNHNMYNVQRTFIYQTADTLHTLTKFWCILAIMEFMFANISPNMLPNISVGATCRLLRWDLSFRLPSPRAGCLDGNPKCPNGSANPLKNRWHSSHDGPLKRKTQSPAMITVTLGSSNSDPSMPQWHWVHIILGTLHSIITSQFSKSWCERISSNRPLFG